jgi:hypothetical protein
MTHLINTITNSPSPQMSSSILTPLSEYAHSDSPPYNHNAQKPVPHPPNSQSNTVTPPPNHVHPSTASSHPTLPSVSRPQTQNEAHKRGKRGRGGGCTDIYFHENLIPGVVSTYTHDFEDTVGEAGGHVYDLLELGVGGGCSG